MSDLEPLKTDQAINKKNKGIIPFVVRSATGIIYAVVFLAAIYFGKYSTAVFLSIVSGFACFEFYKMMRAEGKIANVLLGVGAAVIFPLITVMRGLQGVTAVAGLLIAFAFINYAFYLRSRFSDISVTVMGALYTGFLISNMVLIRIAKPGITGVYLTIAILLALWANDAFAYLFGSAFGKHKMAPQVSPKKSWEGFFAGLFGSVLFWQFIPFIPGISMSPWWALVGGVGCGVAGVIGDLIESRLKREAGLKDSGTMLPGHGGFLDRIDSMLLVSVAAFWILRLGGVL